MSKRTTYYRHADPYAEALPYVAALVILLPLFLCVMLAMPR